MQATLGSHRLLRLFWGGGPLLLCAELLSLESQAGGVVACAVLITLLCLLPLYLWARGAVVGLPIFPIYAVSFLWTYALPLITDHPAINQYREEARISASLTVAGFLGLSTLVWYLVVRRPSGSVRPIRSFRALSENGGDVWFLVILAAADLFGFGKIANYFESLGGILSSIQGFLFGLTTIAVFVLSYRWGRGGLYRYRKVLFVGLLFVNVITSAAGLLLIGALATMVTGAIGFVLGRGRIPWVAFGICFFCVGLLHYGKGQMRQEYWFGKTRGSSEGGIDYVELYSRWISASLSSLTDQAGYKNKGHQSLLERSSLMHMLLLAQKELPRQKPFLSGLTYVIIPQMLVPRFLDSEKIISHAGTRIMSVYLGLQTGDDTNEGMISWGLLNEAFVNFGDWGCVGLALILGLFYGASARYSYNAPIYSSRFLQAIVVLSIAIQVEGSSGYVITMLAQYSVSLIALNLFLMHTYRNDSFHG